MKTRFEQIGAEITKNEADALIIESAVDMKYLTGLTFSAGKIIVQKNGESLLFVDSRYIEMAKEFSPIPVQLDEEKNWQPLLTSFKTLLFDGQDLSWERVTSLKKELPTVDLKSFPAALKRTRAIKDEKEIAKLKAAADLGSRGYDFLLPLLKTGVSEVELAFQLDRFWRDNGGQGFAFEPIIAFGENSAIPHWRASQRRLKKGDTVLLDIGVIYDGYHSDMTRTVYFGEPDSKLKEIYEIVREAQSLAMHHIKAGVLVKDADKAARGYIESKGFGAYFSHSLGHGIGLEIHEWPFLRSKGEVAEETLLEGMCVTVEPGIYVAGLGGVRIEDTVLITSSGTLSMTNRPTDLQVIHADV